MTKSREQMQFIEKKDYSGWDYSEVEELEGLGCADWIRSLIKLPSHLVVIGLETALVVTTIVPTLLKVLNTGTLLTPSINNSTTTLRATPLNDTNTTTTNTSSYKNSAIAFLAFYALGVILTTIYWCCICRKHRYPLGGVLFLAFVVELPLVTCEVHLLKTQHMFSWHNNVLDILFLLAVFLDVFIQVAIEITMMMYTERSNNGLRKCRKRCCCGGHGCGCFGKIVRALLVFICALVSGVLVAAACFAVSYWSVLGESTLHPRKKVEAEMMLARGMDAYTENMSYYLMLVGYAGQWAALVVLVVMLFAVWLCIFQW